MRKFLTAILTAAVALVSCNTQEIDNHASSQAVFAVGNASGSKTGIASDAVSINWEMGDELYLWARRSSSNPWTLDAVPFKVFSFYGSKAYFTTTLSSKMEEGAYDYYCASPCPSSVDGTNASFENPQTQDGEGEGIMLSGCVKAPALRPLSEYIESKGLSLQLQQKLHLLQLFVQDDDNVLQYERIRKIELSFPSTVVGLCTADLESSSDEVKKAGGSSTLFLELENPVPPSIGSNRYYTFATIFPTAWKTEDVLEATVYTASKMAKCKTVKLDGRNMLQGHATPVKLSPAQISNFCSFIFTLNSNPIGEDVKKITLTAPSGCRWGDGGSNVYTLSDAALIAVGTSFKIEYENESLFRQFANKAVTVTYESEHVRMSQNILIPDTKNVYSLPLNLDVPEILCENFDGVTSFSSHDDYTSGSDAYSKDPVGFLNGWTGGRVGGSAGKCVRIACRRETTADYDARMESAPLNCVFLKSTNIEVSFSYGANNKYGGIKIMTLDGNVGQTVYVGYVTKASGYESGSTSGVYESSNSKYIKEYTGSWTSTPNDNSYIIHSIPAGTSPVRISWRSEVEHQEGTTNTTCWFYLDNVKVTIAQ